MNEWLFTSGEMIWGCLKDMKEKWNAKRKLLVVKFVHVQERKKLCNIYLPLQRNSSVNNPCTWFSSKRKREQIEHISIPQIITKVHNLARLKT